MEAIDILKRLFVLRIFNIIKNEVNKRDISASFFGESKGRRGLIYIKNLDMFLEIYLERFEDTYTLVIKEIHSDKVSRGVHAIISEVGNCINRIHLRNDIIKICDLLNYSNIIVVKDHDVLADMYRGVRTYVVTKEFGRVRHNKAKVTIQYTPDDAYLRGDIEIFGRNIVSDVGIFVKKMVTETYNDVKHEVLKGLGELYEKKE